MPGPAEECVVCHPELAQPSGLPVDGGRQHPGAESLEARPGSGTLGMGGDPARTKRCDVEALAGRMGRRETCVVNCAIMANNYPHVGGKRFNKPIVVDLDLPVWGDEDWTG